MMAELQPRHDLFEEGDLTALICITEPELHNAVANQLVELGYKLHTGLFAEDTAVKLNSHPYDVVVIHEHYNGAELETNPVYADALALGLSHRRLQFMVLLGANMVTDDEWQAFQLSVDMVFGIADLVNFKAVLRRAISRRRAFYSQYFQVLEHAGKS